MAKCPVPRTHGCPDANDDGGIDFLADAFAELNARGNKYSAAVVQQEADIEGPAGTFAAGFTDLIDHRLTMRDVILTHRLPPRDASRSPTR